MFEIFQGLSESVRKKRAILGISRIKLSKELNMSAHTLRKIENGIGKVNKKNFEKITFWLVKDL